MRNAYYPILLVLCAMIPGVLSVALAALLYFFAGSLLAACIYLAFPGIIAGCHALRHNDRWWPVYTIMGSVYALFYWPTALISLYMGLFEKPRMVG